MPTVSETIKKVRDFAELPQGWCYGEGVAPSEPMQQKAILFLRMAQVQGISRMNAFPGINGEIQVTFYHQNLMLEFDLELDGSVTIAEDEGSTQISFDENASLGAALNKLREFSEKICSTSESFIGSTTIQNVKISPVVRWIYEIVSRSPSLNPIVRYVRVEESASTYQPSIETKPASLPSIGLYQMGLYPQGADSIRVERIPGTIATTIFTVGRENKREPLLSH